MMDQTFSATSQPVIDVDEIRVERFRFGERLVTIRSVGGHQNVTIDGRRMAYWVTSSGFTLRAAAYAEPQRTLMGAVAGYLDVHESKATLLSRLAFDPAAAVDPNSYAGYLADRPLICGRKNILELNAGERALLAGALNELYASGIMGDLANEHSHDFFRIHFGPAFLPWHRHFLWRLEKHLQSYDARLHVPYWDWTRKDSQDLDQGVWKSFFGGRANHGGRFDHWQLHRASQPGGSLPTVTMNINFIFIPTFEDFRRIEGQHHSGPHNWVGGDMAGPYSPRDPLFFLHHCNIDRLWAIWQRVHPEAEQYPPDGGEAQPDYASIGDINATLEA